jgi:hypothetical protein
MMTFFSDLVGALAATGLGAAVLWTSYLVGARFVPRGEGVSARWCAAAVAAFWLLTAAFWLLVPFGLFRLPVALVLWLALAALVHRRLAPVLVPRSLLASDLRRVRQAAWGLARSPAGWVLAALALVAAVRLLRGTAEPPLGWDALTYHLYKAGRWVQLGTLAPQPAPDAWSYYEYFPVVGDGYWAWAMLPLRSDALITAMGTAIWGTLLLGTYASAREMGAPPARAALVGGAVGAMPSVLAYLSSGYVDNTVAALFALGTVFVLRVWRRRTVTEAPLAFAALGLMLGAKLTTAAFFALGTVTVAVAVVRSAATARTRRIVLLGCLAAAAAGYPAYQRAWVEQGSPFHPFRIALGDVVLSPGVGAATVLAGEMETWSGFDVPTRAAFWRYFLYLPKLAGSFLNPGPGAVILTALGLVGLVAAFRRGRRAEAAFLAACGLLMIAGFLSSNMETFRTTLKVTTSGRYVTIGFVAAAVLGAAWSGPIARVLWIAAVVPGLVLAFPTAWVREELPAVARVAAILVAVVAGLLLAAAWWRRRGARALPAVAACLVVVAGIAAVVAVRREYRYPLYAATVDAADPLFHMHPLHPGYTAAWPIWRALDEGAPHRLAVTAGWDGLGHNWYRYPLLGSGLQNRVLYVPVTADGSIVDYRLREEVARRASYGAWLARLVEERVEYVVSLAPRNTVEDYWMRNAPAIFTPEVTIPGDFHVAYRFDREAALAALRATAPGPPARRDP